MRIRPTGGGWRRTALAAAAAAAGLVAGLACNEAGGTQPAAPSVDLQLVSTMVALGAGKTGTVELFVSRRAGYTGEVKLAVTGAPSALTTRLEPAVLPAGVASARVALIMQAATGMKTGPYDFEIAASAPGGVGRSASLQLVVLP